MKIKNFLNFFKKDKPKDITLEDVVINVDNFNKWFNDPNNGAVYAHPGIFLRTDKLSESHILDYIKKSYNDDTYNFYIDNHNLIYNFYNQIMYDWRKKLNNG